MYLKLADVMLLQAAWTSNWKKNHFKSLSNKHYRVRKINRESNGYWWIHVLQRVLCCVIWTEPTCRSMSPRRLLAPRRKRLGVSHWSPNSSFISTSHTKASCAVRIPPAGLNPTCNTHTHTQVMLQSCTGKLKEQVKWLGQPSLVDSTLWPVFK